MVLVGGVSVNSELRKRFLEISNIVIIFDLKYVIDNGVMIVLCVY